MNHFLRAKKFLKSSLWHQNRDTLLLILMFGAAGSWCAFLLGGRILYTRSLGYWFLAPNLILALIPLFFSTIAMKLQTSRYGWFLLLGWLCFFPNAPYLITDFVHLRRISSAPIWFDVLLLGSFAITGLAATCISTSQIQTKIQRSYGLAVSWAVVVTTFFLAGFGIYLGRVKRWHSIDILREPLALGADIVDRLWNPMAHPRTWGMTIGFGMFLMLCYALFLIPQWLAPTTERTSLEGDPNVVRYYNSNK
jgi:uncharacterized membrane protein